MIKKNILLGLLSLFLLLFAGCSSTSVAIFEQDSFFNTSIVEINSTHTQISKSDVNGTLQESICIKSIGSTTEIVKEVC